MTKKEYLKQYYKKNKAKIKKYIKQWQKDNPEKIKIYREKEDRQLTIERSRKWYRENHKRALKTRKKYRDKNKKKKKLYDKWYREQNRGLTNSIKKRYKLAKKHRTPKWLTKQQKNEIDKFYILAYTKTQETGIEHHVDHIIPLQGKNVSGLHVPWNLQVITAKRNRNKSNKL